MSSKRFPVIASQSFEKFKRDPSYLKIAKSLIKRLGKIRDSFKRARLAHNEVDTQLKEVFKNPATEMLSCKQGCSACCYSQVGTTQDEGELLAQKIIDGHPVDLRLLSIQAEAGDHNKRYYDLPHELRRCVFLDKNDACSIYEDRPMVCRTNYAFNDPAACNTAGGVMNPLRLLTTHKADMAIMGAFEAAKSSGVLATMIWKALKKRGHIAEQAPKFPFPIPRKDI